MNEGRAVKAALLTLFAKFDPGVFVDDFDAVLFGLGELRASASDGNEMLGVIE